MDFPLFLRPDQVSELDFEFVPEALKAHLTRLLRRGMGESEGDPIFWQNNIINRARTVALLPPYVLTADDLGMYEPIEYGWHKSEFEACIRRLDTAEVIELLAELAEDDILSLPDANELLDTANTSVRLQREDERVIVEVLPLSDLEEATESVAHPNIRVLIARMVRAEREGDPAGVLHASASVIEALAKEVIAIPSVQDQTLASFFERYRKESSLPSPVLEYLLELYKRRNVEPLAGHGKLDAPTINSAEATVMAAMTKAFVLIEKRLLSQRPANG